MKNFCALLVIVFILSACATTTGTPATEPSATPNIIIPTPATCTNIVTAPTPGPEIPSLFPAVSEMDRALGSQDPAFVVIYYGDYQDPRSASFSRTASQLLQEYPGEVQVVTRSFPLTGLNDKAAIAAQAVEAGAEQNKFWEVHDLLYSQQANWASLSATDFEQWMAAQASALGMNVEQFRSDLKSEEIVARVQQAREEAEQMGLPGTPLILINGQIYAGPRDYNSLESILQLILLGKRQFTTCPPVTVQGNKQYIAILHTEKGDVTLQLFADKAPFTVNSFIFLARNGWYDNITFHRVLPDLYAQTGDPSGTGKGNPGYYIVTEIDPSLKFNKPGMVAMVNSGPDTSGSQFFIIYAQTSQFDDQYTIFGEVLSGMDVLQRLTPRDAQPGTDLPAGDKLLGITIEER